MGETAENTVLSTNSLQAWHNRARVFPNAERWAETQVPWLESAVTSAEDDIAEAMYMKGTADRESMIR